MSGLKPFREKARELVSLMSIPEKAGLVSGHLMWETRGVERLGLKKADMSDGPHGIRKQLDYYDIAIDESVKTVCFPCGSCIASSWDRDTLNEMGMLLGKNAKIHNVSLLLGPGVNIKRSPLCGRNFEYFSEDPYLAGEMGVSFIKGVQSMGVSSSVKHFAANNQETRRLSVNAVVDERALREIYLPAFEKCVKEADVDVIMSAYNTLNGESCSRNRRLLTDILRGEFGFDGMVVSDWGAVTDDPASVMAGNDIKMPGLERDPERMAKAPADNTIIEEALDNAAVNVTAFLLKAAHVKETDASWGKGSEDYEKNHALAGKLASESMVLLKNDGVLPLKQKQKILIVGEFAKEPHFQGGGSSHVNAYKVDSAVELFESGGFSTTYIADFNCKDEILKAIGQNDIALVFMGKPEADESEGFDKMLLDLPEEQNHIINCLCAMNKPVAAVIFEGSAVTMPWIDDVNAVLAAFLPGEAGCSAVFDILTGKVNPSGKLAETFPKKLEDTPSYLFFPGIGDISFYGESIYVGYRYYDKKKIEPLFPFGHGLSYTSFGYGSISAEKKEFADNEKITISIDVTNTGNVKGKEVVQIYIQPVESSMGGRGILRPVKELKAFRKAELDKGETKKLEYTLDSRSFAWYDESINNWRVETGDYKILAAASSSDIRSELTVHITSTFMESKTVTRDTLMGDIMETKKGREIFGSVIKNIKIKMSGKSSDNPEDEEAYMKMILPMPVKTLILIGMPVEQVDALIETLNKENE